MAGAERGRGGREGGGAQFTSNLEPKWLRMMRSDDDDDDESEQEDDDDDDDDDENDDSDDDQILTLPTR